jgi:hypothetical protein
MSMVLGIWGDNSDVLEPSIFLFSRRVRRPEFFKTTSIW